MPLFGQSAACQNVCLALLSLGRTRHPGRLLVTSRKGWVSCGEATGITWKTKALYAEVPRWRVASPLQRTFITGSAPRLLSFPSPLQKRWPGNHCPGSHRKGLNRGSTENKRRKRRPMKIT